MLTKSQKIVYSTNSTTHGEINLSGELKIHKPFTNSKFKENIRICVSLRPTTNPLTLNEWIEILETKRLTTAKLTNFNVNESHWFNSGINWVIPTPVFETTNIEIKLNPSALLTSGFILEIWRRDSNIIKEFQPSATLAPGATINFKTNWRIASKDSIITSKPTTWTRRQEERKAKPVVGKSNCNLKLSETNH